MREDRMQVLADATDEELGAVVLDRQLPAAEQVYTNLKQAIVVCRLSPNAPVGEKNGLCSIFGISRSPVHTALTRLAEDGFIEIFPQRGSVVAPIKLAQIREAPFARAALEVALLEQAATNWTKAASRSARAEIAIQKRHAAAVDARAFYLDNERFHAAFVKQAGFTGIWATVQGLKTLLDRIGSDTWLIRCQAIWRGSSSSTSQFSTTWMAMTPSRR